MNALYKVVNQVSKMPLMWLHTISKMRKIPKYIFFQSYGLLQPFSKDWKGFKKLAQPGHHSPGFKALTKVMYEYGFRNGESIFYQILPILI